MPLDADKLDRLIKIRNDPSLGRQAAKGGFVRELVRPHQLGPLKWSNESVPCVARRCGSPTMIEVRGAKLCISHAATELNRIIATEIMGIPLSDCTCKAGEHSRGNIHTEDCPIYDYKPTELPVGIDLDLIKEVIHI